jgi:hypothetical protein
MADFLDEKRREIRSRMKELKPLVDEYQRLEAAAAALDGVPADGSVPASRRRPGRPRGTGRRASAGGGRRGRPKGSGTRANEALTLIKDNPGITIPELADKMGIKQNYLYRVVPSLAGDGLVRKDGRGWHAKEAA